MRQESILPFIVSALFGFLLVNPSLARAQTEKVKGQRYFYDAVVKKKESLDGVVDIVAKYSRTGDRKVLRIGVSGTELTPNGEPTAKWISKKSKTTKIGIFKKAWSKPRLM